MTPSDDEVSQVCLRAAEILRRDGWVQGRWGNSVVGWCVSGAIIKAAEGHAPHPLLAVYAMRRVERLAWGELTEWNDYPGRTKEAVLQALMEAAGAE